MDAYKLHGSEGMQKVLLEHLIPTSQTASPRVVSSTEGKNDQFCTKELLKDGVSFRELHLGTGK